jgi:SOS-response transcriptional repressor LexA
MIQRPLTEKQQTVLDYIEKYVGDNDDFPTMRKIQNDVGLSSPNAVRQYMQSLERKGYLVNNGGRYDFARELYFVSRPAQGELKKKIDRLLEDYEKCLVRAGLPRDEASRRRQMHRAEIMRVMPGA